MPNWTSNTLTVSGDPCEVARFVAHAGSKEEKPEDPACVLDFNQFIPMPKEYEGIHTGSTTIDGVRYTQWREMEGKTVPVSAKEITGLVRKYGASNWYDWALNNWGTKWNACEPELDYNEGDDKAVYQFNTAWAMPEPIIDAMHEQFHKLEFCIEWEDEDYDGEHSLTLSFIRPLDEDEEDEVA